MQESITISLLELSHVRIYHTTRPICTTWLYHIAIDGVTSYFAQALALIQRVADGHLNFN